MLLIIWYINFSLEKNKPIIDVNTGSISTIDTGVEKEDNIEEMTLEQICKELGRDVKIVK